jgi:hypothetical protein
MGYQGSVMSMGDFGPNWKGVFANYAITPRDAVGAGYLYMRSDYGSKTRELTEINYTRLLHRENLPRAQGNLWFVAGVGNIRDEDSSEDKFSYTPGFQADYETRRIYFAATARLYRASGIRHDFGTIRGGFSFYETEYDQTQPWFIVEARCMSGLSDKTEITSMLRLINKNFFVEAGINNNSQAPSPI